MNYALITPVKDEIENLDNLSKTILAQSKKPIIWVIIDGNSSDGTYVRTIDLFKDYEWVYILKQEKFHEKGYSHINFAEAVNQGISHILKVAREKKIDIEFIGKTDATVLLDNNYFSELGNELAADKKIAIACGPQHQITSEGVVSRREPIGDVLSDFNDIRLYRVKFLEQVCGYPLSYCPDAVLLLYAKNRGWEVKVCTKTSNYDTRPGGTKIGVWKGYILKGRSMKALGYSVPMLMINSIYYTYKEPHYGGLAIIFGALMSFINKDTLNDDIVANYLKRDRTKDVISSYLK